MKISLNIKRNVRELVLRDIPVYKDGSIESFKPFDVNSENGQFTDAVMMLYINDSDASELSKIETVKIEKRYNGNLILSKDLTIHNIVGSYAFLRYNFSNQRFLINSVADYVSSSGKHYYELNLNEEHGISPNDYEVNHNCLIRVIDNNGNELGVSSDFFVTGGNNYGDQYKLYVNISSLYLPERGHYIELDFDRFIYNDLLDNSGKWHFYSELGNGVDIKFIYENSNVCIPIGISSDTNFIGLRQNELVDDYYKKLTEHVVPDFINPEKTKYVPYVYENSKDGERLSEATKLEFCLHFRTRQKEILYYKDGRPQYGEMPNSSWRIETDETVSNSDSVLYWNEFYDFNDFTNTGKTDILYSGDLIGNLGFTDNDILNRKKKVKQSFLRLSFYSTNDPLQTSMLFYSTIFLDANELYSKYIKLYTSPYYEDIAKDYLKSEDRGDERNNDWGLVLFNGTSLTQVDNEPVYSFSRDELLTTKLTVTSEDEHTSSAEGFNLYLFSDDSPKEDEERTIYLKIEFNHAGYGRTFPMILWPKDDSGKPIELTKENFYESMYIPVIVRYNKNNNTYTYHITRATNDIKNSTIRFALFEPKIEPSYQK